MTSEQGVDRMFILGYFQVKSPELVHYFDKLLTAPTYTVSELNSIFRYEVIRLSNGVDTMEMREWLCHYPSVKDWLRYFSQRVLPFIRSRV